MAQTGWYMIVYDIADEKRLRKVHRVMKSNGLPVQRSVFFYSGHQKAVNQLLDKIAAVMSKEDDDLRAYPVRHPRNVWATQGSVLDQAPLCSDSLTPDQKKAKNPKKRPEKRSWLKRMTRRLLDRKHKKESK